MPVRRMSSRIHAIAGSLAFAIILSFSTSSLVAEIVGDPYGISLVKTAIAWSLVALVPALAATGASGLSMSGRPPKGMLAVKFRRMKLVAANGMLVLVPSALLLAWKAGQGEFDMVFTAVQAVEFAAGSTNLVLIGLNIRDGLRISGRLRRPARTAAGA
jgi:hypothetical protein